MDGPLPRCAKAPERRRSEASEPKLYQDATQETGTRQRVLVVDEDSWAECPSFVIRSSPAALVENPTRPSGGSLRVAKVWC